MKKINNKKKSGGYTLIETMISISLFLIIVMDGMGALLNANLLNKKSQSMRSVMDNLSFVMEDMSRNIRTGYNYHCFSGTDTIPTVPFSNISNPKSCLSGWGIAFEYQYGTISPNDQWVYYIGVYNGKNGIFKSLDGGITFVQLNPDEITIDPVASGFVVTGAEPPPGDTNQPFITIKLVGNITSNGVVTPFILETSASQRQIDI
ncbi:MAG: prepilin-type N-terminal cleavage/methylation domain-containing protein [Candidatus Paceibacterota bacterium]|jgi:type II secretory pathway pseudopilin PulG